ncbi:ATPase, T2SS/T4P/T4SS family [Balneolales bacterium ANBcel1]|nr:ATPase, T2SS/T4P/T4SS family [Balneolales bacterium ANBcel1]
MNSQLEGVFQQLQTMISHVRGVDRFKKIRQLLEDLPADMRGHLVSELEHHLLGMEPAEASDIDIGGVGCNGQVWYRIHGNKKPVPGTGSYRLEETDLLLLNIISDDQLDYLLRHRNLDFSYVIRSDDGADRRFRADMYFDLEHLALNMRRIDTEIRPFKSLQFHPEVARALSLNYLKYGLTLVTGITGSGKSSTLDTIIDANNRTSPAHIVIISAPVELVHTPIKSIIRHREVGRDVPSFREGVVQAMRQDPDIIVIGELRDDETILAALEITDSGHKTFSTLHTASAMESIDRIIGEVPVREQERVRNRLADVITCVVSQKLVPTTDGKRVLAKEVMLATPSVRAAIRNNNVGEIYQMQAEGSQYGMHTLEQDLKRLVDQHMISVDEAMNYANNKKRLKDLLR